MYQNKVSLRRDYIQNGVRSPWFKDLLGYEPDSKLQLFVNEEILSVREGNKTQHQNFQQKSVHRTYDLDTRKLRVTFSFQTTVLISDI